jgi:hypothetical protein
MCLLIPTQGIIRDHLVYFVMHSPEIRSCAVSGGWRLQTMFSKNYQNSEPKKVSHIYLTYLAYQSERNAF